MRTLAQHQEMPDYFVRDQLDEGRAVAMTLRLFRYHDDVEVNHRVLPGSQGIFYGLFKFLFDFLSTLGL